MCHKTLKSISEVLTAFPNRGAPCTQVWRSKCWSRGCHHTAIIIKVLLVFPGNTLRARVNLQRYSSTWNKEALKHVRNPQQEVQEEKAFYCHGLLPFLPTLPSQKCSKGIISIFILKTWNSLDFCLWADSFYQEIPVYMHCGINHLCYSTWTWNSHFCINTLMQYSWLRKNTHSMDADQYLRREPTQEIPSPLCNEHYIKLTLQS